MPFPDLANLFVVQKAPTGEVVFTFGLVAPFVVGTPEEQLSQARALSTEGTDVKVVARVAIPEPTARQMLDIAARQLGLKVSS